MTEIEEILHVEEEDTMIIPDPETEMSAKKAVLGPGKKSNRGLYPRMVNQEMVPEIAGMQIGRGPIDEI